MPNFMKDALVLKAAQFAAQKHKGQTRNDRDKSPYIDHPKSVARIISEVGGIDDPQILAAALLHDKRIQKLPPKSLNQPLVKGCAVLSKRSRTIKTFQKR
jgi:(p)ppGpp synthase/HD superfamily hydrolase